MITRYPLRYSLSPFMAGQKWGVFETHSESQNTYCYETSKYKRNSQRVEK